MTKDKQSGLDIRKTVNGMRVDDGPLPPQHRRLLSDEEIQDVIAAAPRRRVEDESEPEEQVDADD